MSVGVTNVSTRTVTIGIALAILATLSFALVGLLANYLVDQGNPPLVVGFYETIFGLVFALALNARSVRTLQRPNWMALRWAIMTGVLFACSAASFYTALARIDFSVGAPIVGAVPLASYIFVLLVLRGHERLTLRVAAGALLVVAGVGLIGVAN